MRKVQVENMNRIKKAVPKIEDRLNVHISFQKNQISVKGPELEEFITSEIVRAVDFGFHIDDALLITREDFILEFIDIKEHTRRKNLKDVRARIIGTNGKARKTIEKLTGSVMVIHDNMIGVITDSYHLDAITQGIESLINGAKHGNVFAYLEKQNKSMKKFDYGDLGLKEEAQKLEEESDDPKDGLSPEEFEKLSKEFG